MDSTIGTEETLRSSAAPVAAVTGGPRRTNIWSPKRLLTGLAVPVTVLVVWSLVSGLGAVTTTLLPAPWQVATALWQFVAGSNQVTLPGVAAFNGAAGRDVGASLQLLLVAFSAAIVVGIPLGLTIGLVRTAADLLDPAIQGLRAIPIFAWLPWLSYGLAWAAGPPDIWSLLVPFSQ